MYPIFNRKGTPTIPSFTWAGKPAASAYQNRMINITDVGVGGSKWISDGTKWRLMNNAAIIHNQTSNLAVTGVTGEYLVAQFPIPAGLLKDNDFLVCTLGFIRTLNTGGTSSATGSTQVKYRLGTNPSALTDPTVFNPAQQNTGGVHNTYGSKVEIQRISATQIQLRGACASPTTDASAPFNGAVTYAGSQNYGVTVPSLDTDLILSLTVNNSSPIDMVTVRQGTVELMTCGM